MTLLETLYYVQCVFLKNNLTNNTNPICFFINYVYEENVFYVHKWNLCYK